MNYYKIIFVLLLILLFFSVLDIQGNAQGEILWHEICPNTHSLIVTEIEEGKDVVCEEMILPSPTPTFTQTPLPTATSTPSPRGLKIINYENVDLFNNLTPEQLANAQSKKMVFMDRSVGDNINSGLNCFTALSWGESPSYCRHAYIDDTLTEHRTYTIGDLPNVPEEILFDTGLDRSNWTYDWEYGSWQDMVRDFIEVKVPLYYSQGYRIMSFQFSYLNFMSGSDIDEKFFDRNFVGWNILDLEQLEINYPDVVFIYWTGSLARTIGTADVTNFNEQMRQYAIDNDKYLIDMADITSHGRVSGTCLLNGNPIICKEYTTEINGGHLGSVSEGQIIMSKAVWLMMVNVP